MGERQVNAAIGRRAFLRRGSAACAAAMLSPLAGRPASAGRFTGKIRKAVKWHMIGEDLSIEDKLKLVKDVGFDGVEARARQKGFDYKALSRASEKVGVPVHGVLNSSDPDIVGAIDVARSVGADSVLVVVRWPASTASYVQNYRQTQDVIRRAVPHADKHGVRILIENVWASFLIEPLAMARYIDELGGAPVGAYFDVGNNVRWGLPEHWVEALGERIVKLDIKEYSTKLQQDEGLRAGFNVEIGEGSIDWARVREELVKIGPGGFRGWATAEVRGGDRARLADIAARMDRVLDL